MIVGWQHPHDTADQWKEYFAQEGEDGSGKGEEEVNPYGPILLRPRPLPYNASITLGLSNGKGRGDGEGGDGGGGDDGDAQGDGEGGKGDGEGAQGGGAIRHSVPLSNPRAVVTGGSRRRLHFTSPEDKEIEITLFEAGADSDYMVAIKSGSCGTVTNGRLRLPVKANTRQVIELTLDEDFDGALKVVAHELRSE